MKFIFSAHYLNTKVAFYNKAHERIRAPAVYGSKDLRIQNNFSDPIRFQLFVADNYLFARLESQTPMTIQKLNSEIDLSENQVQVILSDEEGTVVSYSTYKRNKENDYSQPIISLENTGCI